MKKPLHISKILTDYLEKSGLTRRYPLNQVRLKWTDIIGTKYSKHTTPIRLKNGTLSVHVNSSALLYELKNFNEFDIIERLNNLFPDKNIKKINFVLKANKK